MNAYQSNQDDEREFERITNQLQHKRWWGRDPKHGSELINQLLSKKGYGQTNASALLEQHWAETVGQTLGGKCQPGVLRRGTLEIIVQNSSVLQEITFQKRTILKALQKRLQSMDIADLKFKVGPLS